MIETVITVTKKLAAIALTVALVLIDAGCHGTRNKAGGVEPPRTLVLTLADHEPTAGDLGEYIAAVRRLSAGSLRIEVQPNWRKNERDYERSTVTDLRAGKIDLAKIGVRSVDELGVNDFQALVAPLLIDSLPLEKAVLSRPMPNRLLPTLGRLGVVGISILPGAIRRPYSIRRPLTEPSAFEGATIGIRPSLVAAATFRALGAEASAYVPGTLLGLDGAELDLTAVEENKFDQPGSSLVSNVDLWPRMLFIAANPKLWHSLTPGQQTVLRRAGREALAPTIARLTRDSREERGILCRRKRIVFVSASAAEVTAFRTALRPVYAGIERRPDSRTLVRAIQALKRRSRAGPAVIPSCQRAAAASAASPTLIDGTYETSFPRSALVAKETDPTEDNSENYGRFRLTLDRGRVTYRQQNGIESSSTSGTFKVVGDDEVIFRFNTGVNSHEVFTFRWSLYRGGLTFARDPHGVSPTPYVVRLWRRVGGSRNNGRH